MLNLITSIDGGVCAARGFRAGGIHCGIRKNRTKSDLALIVSEVRAAAAAVYTKNLVKGAPITVTQRILADGYAQAAVCNSGNANTCNADGEEIALGMCALTARAAGVAAGDVIVASTGVIGQKLSIDPIAAGLPALAASLSADADGGRAAADAILTTDTRRKEAAVSFRIGGVECRLGGIAKGSGMIHPDMATMLSFITTDAAISPAMLQEALSADVPDSFNMLSIDGDTSTNDMCCIMANGLAGNGEINAPGPEFDTFCAALGAVTRALCLMLAADGEGATKLLTCRVEGAPDTDAAKKVAKAVVCSSLVKTAMFGADANWGRELCAIGYSGAKVDVKAVDVDFASAAGRISVCRMGTGLDFSEELAKTILSESEIVIHIRFHAGDGQAEAWGCDLTYDYVKINGDYRT